MTHAHLPARDTPSIPRSVSPRLFIDAQPTASSTLKHAAHELRVARVPRQREIREQQRRSICLQRELLIRRRLPPTPPAQRAAARAVSAQPVGRPPLPAACAEAHPREG
eukprot:CAMPEP_0181206044 /NCGR_PEP_ID=MMETSP1096-20121128/20815_1 /TAXON_ID=156174 ORGANISM="Chrysochromulina ericina, Strain CCMP281" /NCGR_SAMPLE_ID=MMETSP1096 /ASSEMBLY_ACC=CAM_ASM_000453 /LENGTH=108 /DNA_ID=CAMNT_0023296897 /DNA_START=193 /DNA_END=516 /DNA_ORIENTATION=-